jgi:hypothetical protein
MAGGVRVSVAFADDWDVVSPTWTDLTALSGCRVRSWSIDRGRPDELSKTGTGTATLRIVDRAGLFDPTNGSSAYFGLVLPDRQALIELHNPVLDDWHTVFRGFVEDWSFVLDPTRQFLEMQVDLVDGFAVLNDYELMPGVDGDTPPAGSEGNVFYEDTAVSVKDRLDAILADAGWPVGAPTAGLSVTFTGNVTMVDTTYAPGTSALAALFDAADAEFPGVANLYMSRDGVLTFHGRQARFRPDVAAYGINRRDVGDPSVTDLDDTICPVHELGFTMGKGTLFNSVLAYPQATAPGVAVTETEIAGQLVEYGASITAHGKKGLSFTDLLTLEGIATSNGALAETLLFATYYADNYHDPLVRINRMVFKTRRASARLAGPLWKMLTRVEISDLLTLTTAHPGGGGFDEAEFYVEGIHYDCRPGDGTIPIVTLTLDVSSAALFSSNPFDEDPDPE